MRQIALSLIVVAIAARAAHAQTAACTARITSLTQVDDHIEVMGNATMSGCTEMADNAHQGILLTFLSNVGGRTCPDANGGSGPVCQTLTPVQFGTQCLAEGTYTVFASAACSNGSAAPCYPPSTNDTRTFSIVRTVSLTGAGATPNQQNPAYWDIQASYDIPNTFEIERSVQVFDAKTNEHLGGCPWLVTPSGTCTATSIDSGCGREVRVRATACATPKKSEKILLLPPGQTTVCALRSPADCPDCEKNRQLGVTGNGGKVAKPINVGGGDVSLTIPLFSIDEPGAPLSFSLYYESERPMYASISGEMGFGWSHSFAQSLTKIDA